MKLLAILHSRYLIPENISNGQNFQTGHGLLKEAGIIAPTCHIPHKIFDSETFLAKYIKWTQLHKIEVGVLK